VVTAGENAAPQDRSGWRDSPPLRQPDGVNYVDALCDQADKIDRAERIRQLAQADAIRRAEAALKEPKPELKEPEPKKDKK
jgi:hypothetical protein